MANPLAKIMGNYPAEYNRAIHGPYDPARFYGKGLFWNDLWRIFFEHRFNSLFPHILADTPLSQVKVGELFAWLNRRNVHPVAIAQCCSRNYQRFVRRFVHPKYSSPIIFTFQLLAMLSTAGYFSMYPKFLRKFSLILFLFINPLTCLSSGHHKQYKYHW